MRTTNISVIITSYNTEKYIIECLESVRKQTVKPKEIIVVDDCSEDNTKNILDEYIKNKVIDNIQVYSLKQNKGVSFCRNYGAGMSSGSYLVFLDGDDYFYKNKLEIETNILDKVKEDVTLFSNYYILENNKKYKWIGDSKIKQNNNIESVALRKYPKNKLFRNEIVPRKIFHAIGGYDINLNIYEDWEFRIRLAMNTRLIYCQNVGSIYRIHSEGASSYNKSKLEKNIKYIYHKHIINNSLSNIRKKFENKLLPMIYRDNDVKTKVKLKIAKSAGLLL